MINENQNSQVQQKSPYRIITEEVLPLGFLAYGGPLAHVAMYRERFVQKNKWVTEQEFQEMFTLCQSLPGPTSTQIIIALGTLVCRSWLGGFWAFLLFSLPSAVFMLLAGLLFGSDLEIPKFIQVILLGFQCAAVGVVAQAALKLSIPIFKNRFTTGIMIGCIKLTRIIILGAVIFLMVPYTWTMYLLLVLGPLANYIHKHKDLNQIYSQIQQQSQLEVQEQPQNQLMYADLINQGDYFLGYKSIAIYLIIFFFLIVFRYLNGSMNFIIAAGFYKIGSLIVGGGHVVLPMILSEFQNYGWITDQEFWDGFSLISCMPGPMFNISIYVGAVIGGFFTGIIAWAALFLPALLMIYGFLPYWGKYRNQPTIKIILEGMSASAIGFVISAVVLLFISAAKKAGYLTTLVFAMIGLMAMEKFQIGTQYIILGGGLALSILYLII